MNELIGSYNFPLIILSVIITIISSYAAIELSRRAVMSGGRARTAGLLAGAFITGLGIWAMHFIGMLAFHLPIDVEYNFVLMFTSLILPVFAAYLALSLVSRTRDIGNGLMAGAALIMGIAMTIMHYTGMVAMRMDAKIEYTWYLLLIAIGFAVGASCIMIVALYQFRLRGKNPSQAVKWYVSLLLGLSISSMHYMAMMAAKFVPANAHQHHEGAVVLIHHSTMAAIVGAVTLFILLLSLVLLFLERRRNGAGAQEQA